MESGPQKYASDMKPLVAELGFSGIIQSAYLRKNHLLRPTPYMQDPIASCDPHILTPLPAFSRTLTRSSKTCPQSSSPSSLPSASSVAFRFFLPTCLSTRTTLVGLLVLPAAPSSALDVTKIYGIPWSSQSTGRWLMTSIGEISAARMQMMEGGSEEDGDGMGDLRMALTTSLTPRLRAPFLFAMGTQNQSDITHLPYYEMETLKTKKTDLSSRSSTPSSPPSRPPMGVRMVPALPPAAASSP